MKKTLLATLFLAITSGALADITIGVTLSLTGPAASLGLPEKNTIELLPKVIAGQTVNYLILDDASNPATAISNTQKLIGEHQVDLIIGSTTVSNSLAMIDLVAENETPMISLAAAARLIAPMDAQRQWVFKTAHDDTQMSTAIIEHMTNHGVKSAAYIGFSDAYGDTWWQAFSWLAEVRRIKMLGNERFHRAATDVSEQVLKLLATQPDAVLIGGAGSPAMLPAQALREHGYTGLIYQTHAVANDNYLRACGPACEGTLLPSSPLLVAEQLPADNPVKPAALAYIKQYQAAYGAGSINAFGSYAWDAGLLLGNAAPIALKTAPPGSREFRVALRDALEGTTNLAAANGVFNMSANDHLGLDQRARVMVTIRQGRWKLVR